MCVAGWLRTCADAHKPHAAVTLRYEYIHAPERDATNSPVSTPYIASQPFSAHAPQIFSIDLSNQNELLRKSVVPGFAIIGVRLFIMSKLIVFALFLCAVSATVADYNGPFLLWGPDSLKDIDISALASLDEKTMRNLYSESSAVVVFVRNSTSRLNVDNYPTFASVVSQGASKYLTQYWLPADPVDYNANTEVIITHCVFVVFRVCIVLRATMTFWLAILRCSVD